MMKPWRVEVGALLGLAFGFLLWWSAYDARKGLLQNAQLVLVPVAIGVFVVSLRNRRKKVGPYDPDVIERNKRGTL